MVHNPLLTAKSLQSCPTLCDPIEGSPPGSPIPGILQARTLEWVAISFSNAKSESEVAQSCPTPSDPMDCSLPGSSVHGIFQERVLEWGAIAFSVIIPLPQKKNTNILIPILLSSFPSEGPCPLRLLTSPFQLHILTWREVTYCLFFLSGVVSGGRFCKFCCVRGTDLRDGLKLELCLELFFNLKCSPPSFGGKKYFKPCFLWHLHSRTGRVIWGCFTSEFFSAGCFSFL